MPDAVNPTIDVNGDAVILESEGFGIWEKEGSFGDDHDFIGGDSWRPEDELIFQLFILCGEPVASGDGIEDSDSHEISIYSTGFNLGIMSPDDDFFLIEPFFDIGDPFVPSGPGATGTGGSTSSGRSCEVTS